MPAPALEAWINGESAPKKEDTDQRGIAVKIVKCEICGKDVELTQAEYEEPDQSTFEKFRNCEVCGRYGCADCVQFDEIECKRLCTDCRSGIEARSPFVSPL